MTEVILTALGVGGATVIGAVVGFIFKDISHKFSDVVLSFAAGVMLAAAVLGLIIPSVEHGGEWGIVITIVGIFAGAICLNLIDKRANVGLTRTNPLVFKEWVIVVLYLIINPAALGILYVIGSVHSVVTEE